MMSRDFLTTIIASKLEHLAVLKSKIAISDFNDAISSRNKHLSFYTALTSDPDTVNIIAEIKRRSPSKGIIKENLDCMQTAMLYEQGGAAGISVLTEENFFGGSNDDLMNVKKVVSVPVLRKDFIVSDFQVYESAAIGADAILLIVRILSKEQICEYIDLAQTLGLECLVEINSEDDIRKIEGTKAKLIGINNRDLKTFSVDIQKAQRLGAMLDDSHIIVALSGINGPDDVKMNLQAGIRNFLVGESIVRSGHPDEFIEQLRLVK